MSSTLIKNIRTLVNTREISPLLAGPALADLPCIEDAFLLLEDGIIAGYGKMSDWKKPGSVLREIDARGRLVLPGWCDSHTHLVFAGSRENELVSKIRGKTYAEIHAAGGGILNSARKLNETSEETLFLEAWERLEEISKTGTTAVEIKSGYGLTIDGELKMLRVIRKLKERSRLTIKSTFLAAHSYPEEYRNNHQGYIDLILEKMLPVVAREKLADFIDVFCEEGFFSPAEMETICVGAKQYGLRPKLHVNQLHSIGGIEKGIRLEALSLDHLEVMTEEDIRNLAQRNLSGRNPVCTLLPTAAFFLRMPLQPARQLIDAGAAIALASDYNPGSSPSGNMNFVVALSCIQMRMLPEEAINAATLNGAHAMDCQQELGSITVGKKANLLITKPIPSIAYLPYAFGTNCIEQVMVQGEFIS